MAEKNVYQGADWNGQSGERWVAYQARLDAMMAVFGQAAIEAAAPAMGERVLDVGCGAGASSLDLAARVGAGGHVLGVDISEPLIGRARASAAGYAGPVPGGRRQQHRVARGRVRHLVLALRSDVL
jgi:SAM-dependent methyltransferase